VLESDKKGKSNSADDGMMGVDVISGNAAVRDGVVATVLADCPRRPVEDWVLALVVLPVEVVDEESVEVEWVKLRAIWIGGNLGGGGTASNPLIDGGGRKCLGAVAAYACFRCEVSVPSEGRRDRLGCNR
jgi:hypothetical protein